MINPLCTKLDIIIQDYISTTIHAITVTFLVLEIFDQRSLFWQKIKNTCDVVVFF